MLVNLRIFFFFLSLRSRTLLRVIVGKCGLNLRGIWTSQEPQRYLLASPRGHSVNTRACLEKPRLWLAKVELPSVVYLIFNSLTISVILVSLDRSFESATYGLQSSILGLPFIIVHKSPMNLLLVLVAALLKFACELDVCHIEIFQMDLWPLSNI